MTRIRRLKKLNRLMPGLLASALVIFLMQLHAWAPLERMVNNQLIRWRGPVLWDSRIVMVKIDDATLDVLGPFPLSHDYYAELISRLQQENVSVVAFNLLFSDSLAAGETFGAVDLKVLRDSNARLAAAMASQGRVVIGQGISQEGDAIAPIPILKNTAISTGHLRLQTDPDGFTRWVNITLSDIPALGIATAQAYSLEDKLVAIPPDTEKLRINWPGPATSLAALSLVDVLNGDVPDGYLEDKVVIVGYGAETGRAQLRTPFDNRMPVVGGYMHAAVVHNLLQQNWLRTPSDGSIILLMLMSGAAFSGCLYRQRILLKLATGIALSASWLLLCMVALRLNYLLPVVPPMMTIVFVGASIILLGRLQSSAMIQVRSAFLNTISHEIRTPLNAIINLSKMLQATPLDDRQREFADGLHNSSQTLLALINDVLDFSKIESEQLEIEDYPVNLSEIVERSLEMLAPRAAEKNIELVYAITPQTPVVIMSDPVRLQQILLNLLSNAVKFTESGEISVEVDAAPRVQKDTWRSRLLDMLKVDALKLDALQQRLAYQLRQSFRQQSKQQIRMGRAAVPSVRQVLHPAFDPDSIRTNRFYEVRFAVKDTGIGIPPDQINDLFTPFSQVSPSTTRKYGGTGLGLAISQRLSEQMGGRLWVKSQLGRGSTFSFTVKSPAAPSQPTFPEDLVPLSNTHLLLVDGNPVRTRRLSWELAPFGIELTRTSSLAAALDEVRSIVQSRLAFDAIILDEAMVGDEHAHTIDALRSQAEAPTLPIILLSTLRNDVPNISRTTILWKPIKQEALYQALRFISVDEADDIDLEPLEPILDRWPVEDRSDSPPMLSGQNLLALPGVDPESQIHLPLGNLPRTELRILVAEDNRTNQRVALRMLELLGYEADVASSGTAVLEMLGQRTYDVILMDMRMPGLDGIETTQRIRQMPEHQQVWIVAMTANDKAQDRDRCLQAGMNDYVSKPINREALNRSLERCLAVREIG